MAAANTDKFRKVARRWVGQIGAAGVTDAVVTTIPLSSSTNLPTDTAVTVVIDRVDANGTATASLEESITGVVSGNNLVSCVRGVEGTAQSHNAGAVVEVLVTAAGWNDFVTGFLVDHEANGTHGTIAGTTLALTGAGTITACSIGSTSATTSLKVVTGSYQTAQTYAPSGAGTSTLNLALGNEHIVTMPATTQTLAISNGTTGQKFIVSINNVTSQGTLTWFSTIKWAGGSAPTLTGTNGKRDTFGFIVSGSGTYDGFVVGQNI